MNWRVIAKMKLITVSNGNSDYPGNFTKEEIKIIKRNIIGKCLHLFSGKSDIGNIRVDYKYGNVKSDVFLFLGYNQTHFDTIIIDAPYNHKFACKYQELGTTPEQFIIFANTQKTTKLFNIIDKLDPEIIILKSWNYYCLNRYEIKESYLCYPGGFRKSTILLIMKRKQMKLFINDSHSIESWNVINSN